MASGSRATLPLQLAGNARAGGHRAGSGLRALRFRFRRDFSQKHGRQVVHFFPTPEATKRARQRVRTVLAAGQGRGESLDQMVEQVNYGLRGWASYYAHCHASQAFDKLQAYTNRRLRRHLRRRRQKSGLGRYKEMPDRVLYEKLGLAYIRRGRVRYVEAAC